MPQFKISWFGGCNDISKKAVDRLDSLDLEIHIKNFEENSWSDLDSSGTESETDSDFITAFEDYIRQPSIDAGSDLMIITEIQQIVYCLGLMIIQSVYF